MPRRNKDTQGKFLPNTTTPSSSEPSLFFDDYQTPSLTTGELEDPLGDQREIFEEPIGEEEEETIPPTYTMAENRNGIENMTEGAFPIRETNGDARMKNIIPSALPHFHGLTLEDPDTFSFDFFVIYRTDDYTSDDQRLKLFPSTIKEVYLH